MLRRLLRVLLIPLLLVGLGYAAQTLGLLSLDLLSQYHGPSLGDLPPGRATEPISQRVVVVVVDALREDTSRQMPNFERLREQGADLPSWTELPSLSLPGYTVLGTGAYPDLSGVATNWYEGAVHVDSLFARAQSAGVPTALVTMGDWEMLYGPWVSSVYTVSWPASGYDAGAVAATTEAIGQEAQRILQETDVALLYVHFGETDEVGHAYGGTSPEYLEAALHVDKQIGALAAILDRNRDTLILTADHGMSGDIRGTGGGHGGGEAETSRVPLVLFGHGIRPGVYPNGRQADVVPTIAALLGLPIPAENQGRTRLDALVLPPQQRADEALALGEQQASLYGAYMRTLGARTEVDGLEQAQGAFQAGQYDRVAGLVDESLGRLDEAVARAVSNHLWQERIVRLPYLVLPLLAGALYVGLYRPRRELLWPILLALLFFLLYQGLYGVVRGYTFSFTSIAALDTADFFMARTVDAAIVMAIVAVVAGVLWRRRPWAEVVWGANQGAMVIAWALLVQFGLYLWLYGLFLVWRLPDLGWGFKFYIDLLATVGVGYAGFLFPWLVLGVSRLPWLGEKAAVLVKRVAARMKRRQG